MKDGVGARRRSEPYAAPRTYKEVSETVELCIWDAGTPGNEVLKSVGVPDFYVYYQNFILISRTPTKQNIVTTDR